MASSSTPPPHPGNSFNMNQTQNLLPQSQQPPHLDAGRYDIFLSHSGAQKGFVKGLFKRLSFTYSVFFDESRASLPLGDHFPTHIFHAAKTCKLAIVVLSDEFFSSKWPMLELSAFIDAMPFSGVKILPLFYELSPNDLKDEKKRRQWHERWEKFASKDNRITMSSWSHALRTLVSINGPIFKKSGGELAFLEEIESSVYRMTPPLLKSSHDGIRGKDRLCKVFIDKFEELERRPHIYSSADLSIKVYLLGVYGLVGSGKTTLCACLCDHFFSTFAGRVLHLNLPSDPTPTDLLQHAKKLFELTDFGHNREELLSRILDISEVFSLLKVRNLQKLRVFLIIDNITSQDSMDFVEAILQLGVGAESRVMLVARTLKILDHSLLNISKCCNGHIHYVCDTMRVPSINEKEAIDILMQPAGGLGLDSNYSNIIEKKYSARHKVIITQVARMCAFGNKQRYEDSKLYLPLALKIIGSQLRSTGIDLEKWERQLSQLDNMVKEFKEDAVRKIVEYSYGNLDQNLKLIFLDVALFMIPYHGFHFNEYEEAVELLSFMHECDPESIKRQVEKLVRLCFLDWAPYGGEERTIIAQDFFLEFAKSLADASTMYHSGTTTRDAQEVAQVLRRKVGKSDAGLRAVILEVDEKCERFDFPEGLSSIKAVVVRNCKSLATLGLAGLTSLVSLFVEKCPDLRHVELDPSHAYTLKSVKWACNIDEQLQCSSLEWPLDEIRAGKATQVKQLIKKGWCSMWDLGGYWPQRPLNGLWSLASRLKALQALRLQGTGITSLGDLSSYWPQLRVLEVLEDRLEEFEVGNLPHLKRFFFGDEKDRSVFIKGFCLWPHKKSRPIMRARMAKRPKLLVGCPALEDVRICRPSFEDGMGTLLIPSPSLRTLWLKDIFCGEPVLPDFTSSAHSLEDICLDEHQVLQRVEFTHQFVRVAWMTLRGCNSLVRVTGLECLPSLRYLRIWECSQLQAVENLEGVRMLEKLSLRYCPVLVLTLRGLRTLVFLADIEVIDCPNVQFAMSDLENLAALRELVWSVYGNTMPKLENLGSLESLNLRWERCEGQGQADEQVYSLCGSSGEAKCEHVNENENAQLMSNMPYVPLLVVGESAPAHLSHLQLWNVRSLVCLCGVHRLLTLKILCLHSLPQLTCLQGLECLTNLQTLLISDCSAVERLPSLGTLVKMEVLVIEACVKVKSLEGCDKMGLVSKACFDRCENLEHCPISVLPKSERWWPWGILSFSGCKFASIKVMVGWVLDEKVSAEVCGAAVKALAWELTDHLLEKPRERMELAEQLLTTLGVYLSSMLPDLTHDHFFDFQPWVEDLKAAWGNVIRGWRRSPELISFPRGMERLMEKLGRVPLKGVLQQCQSDARFRASVAHCLLQTDSRVLNIWFQELWDRHAWWSFSIKKRKKEKEFHIRGFSFFSTN